MPYSFRLLDWIAILFGFADAFLLYLASSYVHEAVQTENVGLFYVVTFAIVLVGLLYLHTLIRYIGKTSLASLTLFGLAGSGLFLVVLPPGWAGVVVLSLHLVFVNIAWTVLDVIIEDVSEDGRSGRIRGVHLALMNAGFLFAPFLASRVLEQYGFSGVFLGSALTYMTVFLLATLGLRRVNHRFREKIMPSQTMRKAWRMPDIPRIYLASFALEFFYAIMIVYMPFRLLDLGFSWNEIGVMFTVMLLPFALLQYPIGRLADRYYGEKEMLIGSLLLMAVSVGAVALISAKLFWLWTLILLLTRIGAAAVEVLRDAYFYKQIDGNDGDLIAFFRTNRPVANIVAAALAAVVLSATGLPAVFWLSVVVSLFAAFSLRNLRDTEPEGRA